MSDLRAAIHGPLLARGRRRIDTAFGPFALSEFLNLETHRSCLALAAGDPGGSEPLLARVHSSCVTSEFLGACDCDCAAQLDRALEAIAAAGRGVFFYLDQEGRGAGLAAKARDRMLVQASRQRLTTFEAYDRMGLRHDLRRYDEVAAMAKLLGLEAPLVLLTNNPAKAEALEREKLRIARLQPVEHVASPFNVHYLSAKRRSGHALADASATLDAELPEAVEVEGPRAIPGRPELVRVARYLLPVLPDEAVRWLHRPPQPREPAWLRLHLYVDAELGGEIVVLEAGAQEAPSWLARIHPEPLLDRLPLREAPARAAWSSVVAALARHGAGVVVLSRRGASGACSASERAGAHHDLLAHHLQGRAVVPLRRPHECDPSAPLRDRGLRLEAERLLDDDR